ncbi:MAG TPA: hypothetical protein VFX30_15045 [bacterium]|nr:hypothetical protein [bacterium]
MNWSSAGRTVGLRGEPHNAYNSLVLNSRLFEAVAPTGDRCLGFFLKDGANGSQGDLFLAPRCQNQQAIFKLEIPPPFRSYRHCTHPFAEEEPALLRVHTKDGRDRVVSRTYVRLKDLWKDAGTPIRAASGTLPDWGSLLSWGGLEVTRAFPTFEVERTPSPWARYVLKSNGVATEAVAAAARIGMEWVLATENPRAEAPRDPVLGEGFGEFSGHVARAVVAHFPDGQRSDGFLTRHSQDLDRASLLLPTAVGDRALVSAFRLEGWEDLRREEPLKIRLFTPELARRGETRSFVRTRDVWRSHRAEIDRAAVQAFVDDPARLALWGGLRVTRPFDCEDIRTAPSPWARFALGDHGLEGALAARNLGMTWVAGTEDESVTHPLGSVFSHGPL